MHKHVRKGTNYWACTTDWLAVWRATLSVTKETYEKLYRFADDLFAAGEKHAVLDVLETRPPAYRKEMGISYTQFMQNYAAQTGELRYLLFGSGAATVAKLGTLRLTSRLCYFDAKGQQVEAAVTNLGLLLQEVYDKEKYRRYKGDDFRPYYISQDAPIGIYGDLIDLDQLTDSASSVVITFALHSDIWFPWVWGFNFGGQGEYKQDLYDNRLLANCHTPRLNAFLRETRQLVEKDGGTWEVRRDYEGTGWYEWLVKEDGIDLAWRYSDAPK